MKPFRIAALVGVAVAVSVIVSACGGSAATPTTRAQVSTPTAAPTAPAPVAATAVPAATQVPTTTRVAPTPTPAPTATLSTPQGAIKRGGVLKQDDASTVSRAFQVPLSNPALGQTNYWSSGLIYQTLFQFDAYDNNKFKGVLVDKWEYSPTADQVTIHLYREAKWSDGKPVTAQDVKFNLDYWVKPPERYVLAGPAKTAGAGMKQIDVVDEKTAQIALKGPDVSFLALLADPSSQIRPSYRTLEQTATEPLGSGAYLLKDVQPDVKVTTVKNPNYWVRDAQGNPLPYLDGVENLLFTDNSRIWAAISVGQIDMSHGDRVQVFSLKSTSGEITKTMPLAHQQQGVGGTFGWGVKNIAPYNNPQFMRAMNILTDRLGIVELVLGGRGAFDQVGTLGPSFGFEWALPMTEILSTPGFRYLNKKTGELETDMNKVVAGLSVVYQKDPKDIGLAKQLLKEAGMDPAAGKFPKIALSVSTRFENYAVVISQSLSEILEVKIPIEVFDEASATDRYSQGKFEGVVFSLYGGSLEPSQTLIRLTTGNGQFNHGFVVPELDALFQQQKAQVDPVKRKAIIWDFQRKFLQATHVFPGAGNTGINGLAREWVKGHWRIPVVSTSNTFALDRIWLDK